MESMRNFFSKGAYNDMPIKSTLAKCKKEPELEDLGNSINIAKNEKAHSGENTKGVAAQLLVKRLCDTSSQLHLSRNQE